MLAFVIITAIFVILYAMYWVYGPIDKKTDNSPADDGLNLCAVVAWFVLSILWTAVIFGTAQMSKSVFGYIGVLILVMAAFFMGCVLLALIMYLITWLIRPSLLNGYSFEKKLKT